jgi:polyhydroxybutyrate depolymerase
MTLRLTNLFLAIILSFSVALGQSDSLIHDGLTRYFLVHLPTGYNPQNDYPLVLALHGGVGSGPQLEKQSGLSDKADAEKFILVYPDGVRGQFGIRTWNAGVCCGDAVTEDIDDVGFLITLIDTLEKQFGIASDKIFATGMSNGAFMSYRLACEQPDIIAAIAPVAGSMNMDCEPHKWVPIIHFHSYRDNSIPYLGGRGSGLSKHYNPPLDSILGVWATQTDCKTFKDTLRLSAEYDHFIWDSCDCNSEYQLYLTYDGGHSWPGGNKTIIGDSTSKAISANDLMWDFFLAHPKCERIPGGIGISEINSSSAYPNPTSKWITISESGITSGITLISSSGVVIQNVPIEINHQNFRLDLSSLPSGLYVLKWEVDLITKTTYLHRL